MTKARRTDLPKAVAAALGVSVDTVGRYALEGLIPYDLTPKGHRRYNLAEVRTALEDDLTPQPTLTFEAPEYNGLVFGEERKESEAFKRWTTNRAAITDRDLTEEAAPEREAAEGSDLDRMVVTARRVLVATGR